MQHLVTNWHVDRDRTAEWEAIWIQLHDFAEHTHGFHMARLMRSLEHPGKYTAYALWDSREVWDTYYQIPEVQQLFRATFRLIKGPPIQEWFEVRRQVGLIS